MLAVGYLAVVEPSVAPAATVTDAPPKRDEPAEIVFEADHGERNDLRVSQTDGSFVFIDRGAPLHAQGDCRRIRRHEVRCPDPDPGFASALVRLGDGADRFAVSRQSPVDLSADVNAGSGDDEVDAGGVGESFDVTFHAGAGDDHVAAPDEDTYVWGGGGDDHLEGGSHADNLFGELGDDRVVGGGSNDRVKGSAGRDRLWGGRGRDAANGGAGDDYIHGGAGAEGEGHKQLRGGAGKDLVVGGKGDDELEGDVGPDELRGKAGADVLEGEGGRDRAVGGAGNDDLISDSRERLRCGAGTDRALAPGPGVPLVESCEQTETWLRNGSYWFSLGSEPTLSHDLAVFSVECQDHTRPCSLRMELSDPAKPNARPFASAGAEFTPEDFEDGPAELAVPLDKKDAARLHDGLVVQVTVTDRGAGDEGSYRTFMRSAP